MYTVYVRSEPSSKIDPGEAHQDTCVHDRSVCILDQETWFAAECTSKPDWFTPCLHTRDAPDFDGHEVGLGRFRCTQIATEKRESPSQVWMYLRPKEPRSRLVVPGRCIFAQPLARLLNMHQLASEDPQFSSLRIAPYRSRPSARKEAAGSTSASPHATGTIWIAISSY